MQGLQDFICIDLETTGLNPKRDRIIEIGAVKVRNGQIVETFQQLIDPKQQLEERVEILTGITSKELEGNPTIQEILPKLQEFLGEDVLLGHRVLVDYSFLKRAFTNEKIPFERKGIDTLKLHEIAHTLGLQEVRDGFYEDAGDHTKDGEICIMGVLNKDERIEIVEEDESPLCEFCMQQLKEEMADDVYEAVLYYETIQYLSQEEGDDE